MSSLHFFAIYFLSFVFGLTVTSYVSLSQAPSYFFLFLIFTAVLFVLTFKFDKGKLSTLSFYFFVGITGFYGDYFYSLSGDHFLIGGDARKFFDFAYDYGVNGTELIGYRYWFFIYLVGNYFRLLNYFHVEPTYLEFSMLTSFFSSISVSVFYKVAGYLLDVDRKEKNLHVAMIWIVTPLFFYLAVGQLRDVYTYFAVGLIFLLVLKDQERKISPIIMFPVLFLILIYIFLIRIDVAFFVLSFLFFFFLFKEKNHIKRFSFILALLVMVSFFYILSETFRNQFNLANFMEQSNHYNELCQTGCDGGSFIKRLQETFLGIPILAVISIFTPFPSLIFNGNATIHGVLEFVFVLFWIFAFTVFFLYSLLNKQKSAFEKSFVLSVIVLMFLLAFTTVGAYRQKLYIYPVVYAFFFNYVRYLNYNNMVVYITFFLIFLAFIFLLFFIRYFL